MKTFFSKLLTSPKKTRSVAPDEFNSDGHALQFASKEFKNNKKILLAAIDKGDGNALQFASDELKNDREIVLAAIDKSGGFALYYASQELKNDPHINRAASIANTAMFNQDQLDKKTVLMASVNQDEHATESQSEMIDISNNADKPSNSTTNTNSDSTTNVNSKKRAINSISS